MSKGATFASDLQKLVFNGAAIANIADNAGSSPLTNLYVSLHTADPSGGNQATNEAGYTSYARVAVARTSGGFTVTGASVSPVSDVTFPASTGGSAITVTHFAIGTASSGTGKILYSGPITPNLTVVSGGAAPKLTTASAVTEG